MNSSVTQYERAVKKQLTCRNSVRKKLLERFHVMLNSFLEENPSPTAEDLRIAFGPPKAMAEVLSEMISPNEHSNYRRGKTFQRFILAVLIVLLLLTTIYVFFEKQNPIVVVDDYYPTPETIIPAS